MITRRVNPVLGPVVLVKTVLAATKRSRPFVVVIEPLSLVALLPTNAVVPSGGLVGSTPLYSMTRTSGVAAATLSCAVTAFPLAAAPVIFLA